MTIERVRSGAAHVTQLQRELRRVETESLAFQQKGGGSPDEFQRLEKAKADLSAALAAAQEQQGALALGARGAELYSTTDAAALPPGFTASPIDKPGPGALKEMQSYRPALEEAYPGKGEIETARGLTSYLSREDINWQVLRTLGADGKAAAGIHLNVYSTSDGKKVAAFEQGWANANLSRKDAQAIFRAAIAAAKAQGATSIIVEMNDPSVWSADDKKRTPFRADNMEFMAELGFKRVEGRYAQPSLDPTEAPVEGLHLGYLSLTENRESVPSNEIADQVRSYFGTFEVFFNEGGKTVEGGRNAAQASQAYRDFAGSLAKGETRLLPMA